jgi:hypothetical protein
MVFCYLNDIVTAESPNAKLLNYSFTDN